MFNASKLALVLSVTALVSSAACVRSVGDGVFHKQNGGNGGGGNPPVDECDQDGDGYVANDCVDGNGHHGDDCRDNNANVHPGASEVCNGIDDNCNGSVDEGLAGCNAPPDSDHDGDPDSSDCNDGNAAVHHGAPELCNGIDDNCDGNVDEGCSNSTDSDGDGETDATDCDDANPNIHHGHAEVCGNSVDDNCDGNVDEGCALGSRKLVVHYRPGKDIPNSIWTKGYLSGAGNSDGYVESLMNHWTADGPNEVFESPFVFPVGSRFEFWLEFIDQALNVTFVLDVCDYPGATQCQGKGDFCAVMYGAANADIWITLDDTLGPVLWNAGGIPERMAGAPRYVDNIVGVDQNGNVESDNLGLCTANGITPVIPAQ